MDRFKGPRDWSVVRAQTWIMSYEVYAVPSAKVLASEDVLATGLRNREARAYAKARHAPPPAHPSCRCVLILKEPTP